MAHAQQPDEPSRRRARRSPSPGGHGPEGRPAATTRHLLPVQGRPGPATLHGIDEQVAKAEKAVAGQAPMKRNRFVNLTGGTRAVNRELEAKARALAGLEGRT